MRRLIFSMCFLMLFIGAYGTSPAYGEDTLLVGYDADEVPSSCWVDSVSVSNYNWKAFRVRALSPGTISYFKTKTKYAPTGCTRDSGCFVIYEDGGNSTTVGSIKAYTCFNGYDWTVLGAGTHTWAVQTVVTDLTIREGSYYWIVMTSWALDQYHYQLAGCSSVIYQNRGASQSECTRTLDGMQSLNSGDPHSDWPPPPAGNRYTVPVASYFAYGVWASESGPPPPPPPTPPPPSQEAPAPPRNLRIPIQQ